MPRSLIDVKVRIQFMSLQAKLPSPYFVHIAFYFLISCLLFPLLFALPPKFTIVTNITEAALIYRWRTCL